MLTSDKNLGYCRNLFPLDQSDGNERLYGKDIINLTELPKIQEEFMHIIPSCEYYEITDPHENTYVSTTHVSLLRKLQRAKRRETFVSYRRLGMPSHQNAPLEDEDIQKFNFEGKESVIEKAITQAQRMLDLPDGWDEENAKRIEQSTFQAASSFLRLYANRLVELDIRIQAPEIDPCPDGSIDLNWHTQNARMLINIRQDNNEYVAYYYGDFYEGKMPFKGNIAVTIYYEFFAAWMKYLV